MVQWDKHIKNHDENRLKVQLKLYFDGSMSFVYNHFTHGAMEYFEKNMYPVKIGIQDWLLSSSEDNSTGTNHNKENRTYYLKKIFFQKLMPMNTQKSTKTQK